MQLSIGNRRSGERVGHLRKSQTLDRCGEKCRHVVRDEWSRDDDLDRLVTVDKAPGRNRPVRAAQAQTRVMAQIIDALWPLARAQIIRAADQHQRERRRQPYSHHIGRNELAETNTGVEAFGRDVDWLLGRGDFQLDLGIGLMERSEHRLQEQRDDRPGDSNAQEAGRTLPQVTRYFARGNELLEGWLCAREKTLAGFGQADTACGADEERCANACLEGAYRLADRRWRHPQLRRCSAKAAVLSNAQERLDAVKGALPDCEVLLHSLTTLSQIVSRRKHSYLYGEEMKPERNAAMNDVLDGVRDHYRATGLAERLKTALASFGPDSQQLTPAQLATVDQFHTRGLAATADLGKLIGITADMSVLDVGSGVGGPARFLAATYGCRVTGVDLSEPFVDAARYLTKRTGQSERVSFEAASALDLPFDDGRFDVVLLQHVAMNIAERPLLYREIRRVLKPGGKFATFDVVLNGEAEPLYPVPWARTPETSFLLTAAATRDAIEAAGFRTLASHDDTAAAKAWNAQLRASGPPPSPNLGLVMGPDFAQLVANLARSLMEGRLGILTAVFEAASTKT